MSVLHVQDENDVVFLMIGANRTGEFVTQLVRAAYTVCFLEKQAVLPLCIRWSRENRRALSLVSRLFLPKAAPTEMNHWRKESASRKESRAHRMFFALVYGEDNDRGGSD